MKAWESVKKWFRKGGRLVTGKKALESINDHPKINIDPNEIKRIERNLREYRGKFPKVKYQNSNKDLVERDYTHMNILKLSAELLSGLVYNEQNETVISDADEKKKKENSYSDADAFIQHVFEHNDFKKNLARYLDPMFAIGGLAVRPYVDTETGEIEYSWALADAFYPLRSNSNGISEGVMKFTTTKVINGNVIYYTLLEFHEWEEEKYYIRNELYRSDDPGTIGEEVNLNELYEGLEPESYLTGLTRPNFNYLKPFGFNNVNPNSPLGLGIADNCRSTLNLINDTYDQFHWEVLMGQRTVLVSDHMLPVLPDEKGNKPKQIFDPKTNVYKLMRMGQDQEFVKDVTNDIRTDQYTAAINQALKTLEMELKLSVGTFSFDGRSAKTATEIVSENDLTYRTRNNHVNEVEKFIKGLIVSTLELAKHTQFNNKPLFSGEIPTFEHIGVDFDDGVFQDRAALLRFYGNAKTFGFIPTPEAITRIFKVPMETAEEWHQLIQKEATGIDPTKIDELMEKELFGVEE